MSGPSSSSWALGFGSFRCFGPLGMALVAVVRIAVGCEEAVHFLHVNPASRFSMGLRYRVEALPRPPK